MKDAPASIYLGAKVFFLEFKQRVNEVFPELFGTSSNGGGENYFSSKWGWYISINAVASNDVTKHEFVYRITIFQFLTHVEFLNDKANEEKRILTL